jgi:hypothetical protein
MRKKREREREKERKNFLMLLLPLRFSLYVISDIYINHVFRGIPFYPRKIFVGWFYYILKGD